MFASSNFITLVFVILSVDAEVTINKDWYFTKENGDVTITCSSDVNIVWLNPWEKFPSLKYTIYEWNNAEAFLYMHSAKLIVGRYNVTYGYNANEKSFESKLHLYNVTHESVGFYFCAKKSYEFLKPLDLSPKTRNTESGISDVRTNVARTYVEVKVAENAPLIIRRIDMFEEDGCPVLIPCPTSNREQSPKLVLTEKNGTQRNIDAKGLSEEYPRLYEGKFWDLGSTNNYTYSLNGKKQSEIDFHLHRMIQSGPLNRSDQYVEIFSKTDTDFVERDQIELTCLYNNKTENFTTAVSVQWITPNNNLAQQEGRVEQSDTCNVLGNKKIIVKNLTANDTGNYYCIVQFRNLSGDYENVTAGINITNMHDANQPLLILPSNITNVTSNLNAAEELLFIRYVAKNSTKFRIEYENIFNNHDANGRIKIEDDSKFVIDMSKKIQAVNIRSRRLIILMIRNLTFFDNANYTVIAKNGNRTANVTLKLVVQGKPTIGVIKINKEGNITGKCDVIALPRPSKVDVMLKTEDGSFSKTQNFSETSVSQSYEFSFKPPKKSAVIILCNAANEIGTDQKSSKVVGQSIIKKDEPTYFGEKLIPVSSVMLILVFVASMLNKCIPSNRGEQNNEPIEKFVIKKKLERLGSGGFGEVHRAKVEIYNPLSKKYNIVDTAIKTLIHDPKYNNIKGMDELLTEFNTCMKLKKHDNVVHFIGAITNDILKGNFVLIFEYCEGINLKEFLTGKHSPVVYINQIEKPEYGYRINRKITETIESKKRQDNPRKYTTTDVFIWASQIANGLKFLAENGISHCDLSARNIIVCNDNNVKICDFGMSHEMSGCLYQRFSNKTLSPRWMAPEVNKECRIFNEKSDIWSFGCVLWEMFTEGKDPFPNILEEDLTTENILIEVENMEKTDEMTPKIFNIIISCLEKNPCERPSFVELEESIREALNEGSDSSSDEDENRPFGNETTSSHQFSESMELVLYSSDTDAITIANENPSKSNQTYRYSRVIMPDENSSTSNQSSTYLMIRSIRT